MNQIKNEKVEVKFSKCWKNIRNPNWPKQEAFTLMSQVNEIWECKIYERHK